MREKSKATSLKTAKRSGFLKPCASGSRGERRSKTGLVDICLIVKFTCTWGLNKKRKKKKVGEKQPDPRSHLLLQSRVRDLCIGDSTVEDWESESHKV